MSNQRELRAMLEQLGKRASSNGLLLTDLTELARNNKFVPVCGREDELIQILEVLNQRCKANPILLGPAGCGKTALVEGVATLLARLGDQLPDSLRNSRVLSLNIGDLVAGTGIVGELEQRIDQLSQAMREKSVILFIDEIHMLYGAGAGGRSQADAANLLKPILAREGVKVIGATTDLEYNNIIQTDPAFERRFNPIWITPLSKEATVKALESYLKYRGEAALEESTLDTLVTAAQHLLPGRSLPDSARDLLERYLSVRALKGMDEPPEALLTHVCLRAARLPLDFRDRLYRSSIAEPELGELADVLLTVLNGTRQAPVVFECQTSEDGEQMAALIANAMGKLVEINLGRCSQYFAEERTGDIHVGGRKTLYEIVSEHPFSPVLLKGVEDSGPDWQGVETLKNTGFIHTANGDRLPVRILITTPVQKRSHSIGFCTDYINRH